MKAGICTGTLTLVATIVLSACSERGSMEDGAIESEAMRGMEGMTATGSGEHVALGTVHSIDRAAGTIMAIETAK